MWNLGKRGPSWKPGESGDLARQGGKRQTVGIRQWGRIDVQDASEARRQARHNIKPPLCTEYVLLCIVHCALVAALTAITEITFSLCYLFQENKSCSSKKPFAFILWCTRRCVEHSDSPLYNTAASHGSARVRFKVPTLNIPTSQNS